MIETVIHSVSHVLYRISTTYPQVLILGLYYNIDWIEKKAVQNVCTALIN